MYFFTIIIWSRKLNETKSLILNCKAQRSSLSVIFIHDDVNNLLIAKQTNKTKSKSRETQFKSYEN